MNGAGMSDVAMRGPVSDDAHFDEQYPLAALDDFLVHQTPDPIRVVASTDPRQFERYWFVIHDQVGELLLALGGSFYPNLDLAESYAIVTHRGVQRSVRAFRPLGADRVDLRNGPLAPRIVRGLREWRLVLEPNEWGIAFDLRWLDTRRQVYHAAWAPIDRTTRARQSEVTAGFEGFGDASGWVEVDGRRLDCPPGSLRGTRDRHWGVGRGVGGPNLQFGRKHKAGWIGGNWINFSDFAIWGNKVLYGYGDARPGMGAVVHVERRLRFEEDTHIFTEGVIDYLLDDDSQKRVEFRRLGNQTAYMRCGLYGGTPDKDIHQGAWTGGVMVEGDCHDLSDPAVRSRLCGLNEHHCEIRCGDEVTTGILQPLEPDAWNACARQRPGWKFL